MKRRPLARLSLLETIFLPLVEQIRLGTPQVYNFRATIPVLLLLGAFFAVVSIRNAHSSTDDTPPLKGTIVAFIANTNEGAGPNVRVTNNTLTVTFLAEATNCDAGLLPAHDEIGRASCRERV